MSNSSKVVCADCHKIAGKGNAFQCMKCKRWYCWVSEDGEECYCNLIHHKVKKNMNQKEDNFECSYCTNSLYERKFTKDEILKWYGYEVGGKADKALCREMFKEGNFYKETCRCCHYRCDKVEKLHNDDFIEIEKQYSDCGPITKDECCYCKWGLESKGVWTDPEKDKVGMCEKCKIKYDVKLEY